MNWILYVVVMVVSLGTILYRVVVEKTVRLIAERGEKVTGEIVKEAHYNSRTGQRRYRVRFPWKGEEKVLLSLNAAVDVEYDAGDEVELLYTEQRPSTVVLAAEELTDRNQKIVLILLGALFCFGAIRLIGVATGWF